MNDNGPPEELTEDELRSKTNGPGPVSCCPCPSEPRKVGSCLPCWTRGRQTPEQGEVCPLQSPRPRNAISKAKLCRHVAVLGSASRGAGGPPSPDVREPGIAWAEREGNEVSLFRLEIHIHQLSRPRSTFLQLYHPHAATGRVVDVAIKDRQWVITGAARR